MKTVGRGGIVIIDEPELHLNPAICKNIIAFLKQYVVFDKNIQIILTTHSAEILSATKEDEECQLLHIINSNTITPILKQDNSEAYEAIKSLGVTTADLLFNKGVIYLEGTTDEEYINEILKGYSFNFKIKSLGGRQILESEVKALQKTDEKNDLQGFHIFIFDFDNKPTSLRDTKNVKIIQWDRYSFENYLLNIEIMYEAIRELRGDDFNSNRADFKKKVKELAFTQIEYLVIRDVTGRLVPQSITLSAKECEDTAIENIGGILSQKITKSKELLDSYNVVDFQKDFISKYNSGKTDMEEDWDENWNKKCKGKELLKMIFKHFGLSHYKEFIRTLIHLNMKKKSEEWQIVNNKIDPILQKIVA